MNKQRVATINLFFTCLLSSMLFITTPTRADLISNGGLTHIIDNNTPVDLVDSNLDMYDSITLLLFGVGIAGMVAVARKLRKS